MIMKKRITRFMASALAAGLVLSAPLTAFADDEPTTAVAEAFEASESSEASEASSAGADDTEASKEGDVESKPADEQKEGGDTTTTGTLPANEEGDGADAATTDLTAHVRIEGIDKMLYNSDVTVKVKEGEKATAKSVLMAADEQSDALTIVGADSNYITEVNGVKAATYGGWDGWMYQVNGIAAPVGIEAYEIASGDSIVLYYSDEYGVGMDYPIMNVDKIAEKKISFTSMKTTYDAEGKASTSEVKVTDMDVTIGGETFKTDANGEITLSDAVMAKLPAEIAISKYAENGCPLVLRYAPGTTIAAPASATPTGDATPVAWLFVIAAGAATIAVATRKKEQVR